MFPHRYTAHGHGKLIDSRWHSASCRVQPAQQLASKLTRDQANPGGSRPVRLHLQGEPGLLLPGASMAEQDLPADLLGGVVDSSANQQDPDLPHSDEGAQQVMIVVSPA